MATLCVYLPKYSITCLGPPKGRLEDNRTVDFRFLAKNAIRKPCV